MTFSIRCSLIVVAMLGVWSPAHSQAPLVKPKVPPGIDPGGIAIALVGYGLDYTDPEIAPRLARDAEGEIIGWDLVDDDNRPSSRAGRDANGNDGTRLAKLLLSAYAYARLVPVRVASLDVPALSQTINFLTRTPARIIALPVSDRAAQEWLRQRAGMASQILIVAAATDETVPAGMLSEPTAGNLVVVGAAGTTLVGQNGTADVWITKRQSAQFGAPANSAEAVAIAAGLAGCTQHGRGARAGFELKADLLALAQSDYSRVRFIEPGCPFRTRPP